MIFHENRLLADNSHEMSYIFVRKLGKMLQNLPSAAVVIGTINKHKKYSTYIFPKFNNIIHRK